MQIAIDTSTSRPLLALLEGETILFEWAGPGGTHHGETLLEGLDSGLKQTGRALKDAQLISVGIGPGTFTGLRIGVVTAKFLADPLGIPITPVSSLHAQALSAAGRPDLGAVKRIWSLTDAKRQEVYALCLEKSELTASARIASERETALRPDSLAARLTADDILLGEGAENYASHWPAARLAPPDWRYLRASSIGLIGKAKADRGETRSAAEVQALYLQTEKF